MQTAPSDPAFTKTEYTAFNALFDAARGVMGSDKEYRLVDPVGKIAHLFLGLDEASAFVRKLVGFSLIQLVFVRPFRDAGDEVAKETYDVFLEKWLDLATRIVQIPDSPLREEERQLISAATSAEQRLEALAARRQDLFAQLTETDVRIAEVREEIAALETLRGEIAKFRERFSKAVNGASR